VEGIQSPVWAYKDGEQENMTKQPSSGPLQTGKVEKVALFRDNIKEFHINRKCLLFREVTLSLSILLGWKLISVPLSFNSNMKTDE
jgi:hypothetical protein